MGRLCDCRRQCLTFSAGLLCGVVLLSLLYSGRRGIWELAQTDRLHPPPPAELVIATGANSVSANGDLNNVCFHASARPSPSARACLTAPPLRTCTRRFRLPAVLVRIQGYFSGLKNLAGSVRFWCPACRLVVYDLGLKDQQLANMTSWCGVEIRNGTNFTRLGHVKKVRAPLPTSEPWSLDGYLLCHCGRAQRQAAAHLVQGINDDACKLGLCPRNAMKLHWLRQHCSPPTEHNNVGRTRRNF